MEVSVFILPDRNFLPLMSDFYWDTVGHITNNATAGDSDPLRSQCLKGKPAACSGELPAPHASFHLCVH